MTIDHDILTMCNGCGLCEAVCKGVKMRCRKDGFYPPHAESVSNDDIRLVRSICPGLNVLGKKGGNHSIRGNVVSVCKAPDTGIGITTEKRNKTRTTICRH